MAKKAPYPYSPETKMWEILRNSSWKEKDLVLRKSWIMQDAIKFNNDFNKVNRAKILQNKVKDEIEKTFNWITDFNHIKALYSLMWQYPNWDVTKIKLKPNCIEFEVSKWEIIKLSVADLPGKHTPLTAFEEASKFNLYIPKVDEWDRLISLMPWNSIKEKTKNFKKLCNLKDWDYLSSSFGINWEENISLIDFKIFDARICDKEEILNVRGAIKQN